MTKQEFLKRAEAKNIKSSRGHDGDALEWDVFFDGKKVCNCFDDARGGELDVRNYKGHSIDEIYAEIDVKSLWDAEYKWTTNLHLLLGYVANDGRLKKDRTKGVLIGNVNNYRIEGFQYTIKTCFKKWSDSKDAFQEIIDKTIKNGDKILNAEYLRTFGLNINN